MSQRIPVAKLQSQKSTTFASSQGGVREAGEVAKALARRLRMLRARCRASPSSRTPKQRDRPAELMRPYPISTPQTPNKSSLLPDYPKAG